MQGLAFMQITHETRLYSYFRKRQVWSTLLVLLGPARISALKQAITQATPNPSPNPPKTTLKQLLPLADAASAPASDTCPCDWWGALPPPQACSLRRSRHPYQPIKTLFNNPVGTEKLKLLHETTGTELIPKWLDEGGLESINVNANRVKISCLPEVG